MRDYVLVARRPIQPGTVVTGARRALIVPAGMQQFHNRAAGYMQVEPAYERPVQGLGAPGLPIPPQARKVFELLRRRGLPHGRALGIVRRAVTRLGCAPARPAAGLGAGELFGPGQAYFNDLTKAQNHAIALQAEIAGIGEDVWNQTMRDNDYRFAAEGWSPVSDYTYQKMMAFWIHQVNRLMTTKSHNPPEADIQDVNRLAVGTEKMIQIVKDLIPAPLAAQAASERKEVEQALSSAGPLKSPGDVARKTLVDELTRRASGLLAFGAIGIAAAAALALGLYLAFGRK